MGTSRSLLLVWLVTIFLISLSHVSSYLHGNVGLNHQLKKQFSFNSNKNDPKVCGAFDFRKLKKNRSILPPKVSFLEEENFETSEKKEENLWLWRSAVLGCAGLWGSNFVVIKALVGNDGSNASVNAAVRFIIAAVTLSPLLFRAVSLEELKQGFEVGVYIGIGYIFQALGLITTNADKSAFICSLQVVTVAIATCIANKKIDLKSIFCTSLGVIGVACLELLGADKQLVIGDFYSIGMPVFFGLSYILIGKYTSSLKDKNSKLAFSAAQLPPVAMMSLAWACYDAGGIPNFSEVLSSPGVVAALIYSGVVSTGLSVILQTYAFEKIPPSEASILVVTEPLWASGFAFLFLGERLASSDILGAALILSACFVNEIPAETYEKFSLLTSSKTKE